MYSEKFQNSLKLVEQAREKNIALEPERMRELSAFLAALLAMVLPSVVLPPVTAFVNGFYVDPVLDKYINVENKKEKQEENK